MVHVVAPVVVVVAAVAAMIGAKGILAIVFFAVVFSLHSLKFCLNCNLLPGKECTVGRCATYDEPNEFKESLASAGFFSPSTIHTIGFEDTNGDVNCLAACSLRLAHNCSEPGRNMCPSVLCTTAKAAVAFEDLAGGEYTVSVNCEESETSCYAKPQEFSFLVQQQSPKAGVPLRNIHLLNVKLYKKLTGRCSNGKVWRSRLLCFSVLQTLMGVVFLLISLRKRNADEIVPPPILEDIKWVLQVRPRS